MEQVLRRIIKDLMSAELKPLKERVSYHGNDNERWLLYNPQKDIAYAYLFKNLKFDKTNEIRVLAFHPTISYMNNNMDFIEGFKYATEKVLEEKLKSNLQYNIYLADEKQKVTLEKLKKELRSDS